MSRSPLRVDLAGEVRVVMPGELLTVGRNGDLAIEDNPYLHRLLLRFAVVEGFWWVDNVGSRIPVHLADEARLSISTLAPGARLPLVFGRSSATFEAGSTHYELLIEQDVDVVGVRPDGAVGAGDTTLGLPQFTQSQLVAILALAEPLLRYTGHGASGVRTAVEAAARLGWTQTRFNRKLDNVCDKLTKLGVKGLHGGPTRLAGGRRARLVEYALAARWVTVEHLPLLDRRP